VIPLSAPEGTATEEAPAPVEDEQQRATVDLFTTELGDAVVGSHVGNGANPIIRVTAAAWAEAAAVAKAKAGCRFFDFLSAIDWLPSPFGRDEDATVDQTTPFRMPDTVAGAEVKTGYAGGDTRFQVLARVANVRNGTAVILKADLGDDLRIATWIPVYSGANWHEREAWEMYGITFEGHPGLRHIYLPTEFEGHPLRKDYPLLARIVKPWPGIVDVEPMPGDNEPAEGEIPAEEEQA
jgi:NADH-quinone oxidoreductase subunit C